MTPSELSDLLPAKYNKEESLKVNGDDMAYWYNKAINDCHAAILKAIADGKFKTFVHNFSIEEDLTKKLIEFETGITGGDYCGMERWETEVFRSRARAILKVIDDGKFCGHGEITGETSDGYHTFNELYDHRCLLWINYCLLNKEKCYLVPNHFDGWFLLGMTTSWGQISYHCPNKFYGMIENIEIKHLEFDGHTPKDVVQRLESLAVFNRNFKPTVQV
jgi:hypothetical protein